MADGDRPTVTDKQEKKPINGRKRELHIDEK